MARSRSGGRTEAESRRFRRGNRQAANYADVDAELLKAAIVAAAETGGALRFGYSSDGGAYAVGIYGDGTPYTEFCRPSEGLDGFLREVEELFNDIAAEQRSKDKGK